MIRSKDRVGQKFNRLLVKSVYRENGKTFANVVCDCGKEQSTVLDYIVSGKKKSCGCWLEENKAKIGVKSVKHSLYRHPLQRIWQHIKGRCLNPVDKAYPGYGGRGISICAEWKDDFKAFHDWAISAGWERGMEIDRYPDNDGNYEPGNCRIANRVQQARNKRNNLYVVYNGERVLLIELKERLGLKIRRSTLEARYHKGWPVEDLIKPAGFKRKPSQV